MIKIHVMRITALLSLICAIFLAGQVQAQPELRFKVATIDRKPFAFKQDGEWTGFSIELWGQVAKAMGATTEYTDTQTFAEMLELVQSARVDVATANISVTSARESVMDFSRPIFDSGLTILAKADQSPSVLTAILKPEIWNWLVGAIILFFVAGFVISVLERKNEHFTGRTPYGKFREGVWWAVSVVTNASFTIFTPFSAAGRLMAYALILAGLFVVSAFVAQITASLTVDGLRAQIGGLDDLDNKRVGTTRASTSSVYLEQQKIDHDVYNSLEELFEELLSGRLDAIVHDAPILAYFAQNEGKGVYQTQGRVFKAEKYGFAMPQGSVQTERINQELLRLKETGAYDALVTKWFGANY